MPGGQRCGQAAGAKCTFWCAGIKKQSTSASRLLRLFTRFVAAATHRGRRWNAKPGQGHQPCRAGWPEDGALQAPLGRELLACSTPAGRTPHTRATPTTSLQYQNPSLRSPLSGRCAPPPTRASKICGAGLPPRPSRQNYHTYRHPPEGPHSCPRRLAAQSDLHHNPSPHA